LGYGHSIRATLRVPRTPSASTPRIQEINFMRRPVLRFQLLRVVAALFVFVLAAASTPAAILRVDADAPGPGHDGAAWASAFTDISSALRGAADGDEIWVASGTYAGGVVVASDVALYGGFAGVENSRDNRDWRANPTIINGGAGVVTFQDAGAHAALDGFTIQNGGGVGVACSGRLARIANNTIVGATAASNGPGQGIACYNNAYPAIVHNVIHDNAEFGIYAAQAGFSAIGNLVTGNGGGIGCDVFSTAQIINNTVADNAGAGIRAAYYSTVQLGNNVVAFNQTGVMNDASRPSAVTLNANDVFGSTSGDYSGVANPAGANGNIGQDPLFADRTAGDYRLTLPSPAVDAGADAFTPEGQTDLDGNPRPLASHVDMGAFEFVPGSGLSFTTQPLGAKAGTPFARQPVVTVRDTEGHVVTFFNSPVTLSILSGPSTGRLTGTTTVNAVNGVATFTNVGVDKGGTYTLRAISRAVSAGVSDPVLISSSIVRVRPDGNDGDDGESWATAKKSIQAALAQAVSPGGEVWVAAGTFTGPFDVPSGVGLYGGFHGNEFQRAQRDFGANVATLKGGGGPVVRIAAGAANSTTVDGFTVIGGQPDPAGDDPLPGAGIVCLDGAPAIRNNILLDNTAIRKTPDSYGGGVYVKGTGWAVENNSLLANSATFGGGLYAEGSGVIRNNMAQNNLTGVRDIPAPGKGAGIRAVGADIEISGNIVRDNVAGSDGGGGISASATSLVVVFNDISGNTAQGDGGGLQVTGSGTVRANTVSKNAAMRSGGGIAADGDFQVIGNVAASNAAEHGGGIAALSSRVDIINNTVVANRAPDAGGVLGGAAAVNNIIVSNSSGVSGVCLFRNNDVFGDQANDYAGANPTGENGNVATDPRFVDASGDFHLLAYSPLIDAGYDAVVQPGDVDRDKMPRLVGAHVDIGAFEYPASVTPGRQPVTFLSMHSVGPDYIGGGRNYLYVPDDRTTFTVQAGDATHDGLVDGVAFTVTQDQYTHWWYPNFNTLHIPGNLIPGYYPDAERAPFASPGHPGIDITGDGRGCNTIKGTFTVLDAVYDYSSATPKVVRFAATFEQHCEGGTGALVGTIAYNSAAVPAPYTMQDVVRAMAIFGGLLAPVDASEAARYDLVTAGASKNRVDIADAILLLRKDLGVDPNP
jgi:hypothetical protein